MDHAPRPGRRTILRSTAAGIGLSAAGCLGLGSTGATDDVVLDAPEEYDRLSEAELPYPIHGEPLPEATVPDPVADREVTTTEFVGERHTLLTFLFTRCSMSCPVLAANLVQVQAEANSEGFADEIACLPMTFDVEYDTAETIEEYEAEIGADRGTDNWWFLRPESQDRARKVVTDTFGVLFEYLDEEDREMENMAWLHSNLILLANEDGYVERAYTGEPPNPATLVEDVGTLRERW